jgi:hypothetical protein
LPFFENMATENILKEIEEKYPVDTVLVNGEQVWPYLRMVHYFAWRKELASESGEGQPVRPLPKTLMNIVRTSLYGLSNWFRTYDYVVLAESGNRSQVDGRYMNRLLDPIIDELGPARVLCIENISVFPPHRANQVYTRHVVSNSLVILVSLLIMLLRRAFLRRYKVINRSVLDKIEADFGLDVDVTNRIEFFEARQKVFAHLFRRKRPRAILLTCYYGKEPAIRAAKSLGIKVVEVQHGVIGREHPAYNVHRDLGRSCFPDHLLVFGKRELATFDNSRFIDQANVHPVGSFYIDYVRTSYKPERRLTQQISGYKRVVGVTLQWTAERRLVSFTCEAAKLDGSILYMLIPRRPEEKAYSNMDLPRNIMVIPDRNFYELMTYCDFHSTVNSTCALEAPSLGVQNILVDIDGLARQYYEEVLSDDRLTRFASTPEEYVDTVRSFARLDRNTVCQLHEGFFAANYQDNIRNFVKTHLL